MYLEGSYIIQKEPVKAVKVLFYGNKSDREVILLDSEQQVVSAYKQVGTTQYMAKSDVAAKLTVRVNKALTKVKKSGGEPTSYNDYPALEFYSQTRNATITIVSDRHKVFKVDIDMDISLSMPMNEFGEEIEFKSIQGIPYVELSSAMTTEDGQEIVVRTVEEIKLTKEDVSWLERVKGIVVQDDAKAEKYFEVLENTTEAIAYDTEGTGVKMNCFGKINSKYARELEKYNAEHAEKLQADRLCGIIFATKTDTAVYFPCFSRKFKVLYEDDTPTRRKVIERIRADYTIGRYRDRTGDMADLIRSGAELTPDVILMERVRFILETKYIIAHNGAFEYKVGFMYDIITNLRDDTMLLHQILYRYGPDPRHRKSNLKYLSKLELGIDQWGLQDFFPAYKEDEDARLRAVSQVGKKKKKKKVKIDFSYMDLEGAKIYAPADGYCTKALWVKYKKDLKENYPQMERIYLVEVAACIGIAYCEFYGHKLDVDQIEKVKQDYIEKTALLESKIRAEANLCQVGEDDLRQQLELTLMSDSEADKLSDDLKKLREEALQIGSKQLANDLKDLMAMDVFNIGSSKQLCTLFYDTMGLPETSKGRSVAKDAIKALLEHKNADGSVKYPIVKYYKEWKAADTLLSKFFDNLGDYMWPGGIIFSSYGQIAAATGRMSCIAEGELVTLAGGRRKRIEDVQPFDKVYCFDDKTLMLSLQPVLVVKNMGKKECVKVSWKSEYRKGSLVCTPDHKIRNVDGEWVQAGSLQVGDILHHFNTEGDWSDHVVTSVESVGVKQVYDLAVTQHHNFIASDINVSNCKQPNAQQYPKAITKIVIPRENCVMMDADFSQIEYRVLVALAQEPGLLKKFCDPDVDYHTMMASLMFGVPYDAVTPAMRSDAKKFNFGIPYGMGIGSIAMGLYGENTPRTRELAKQKKKLYFKEQPLVEQYFERVKEAAVVYGYTETLYKRRRYYVFTSANPEKAKAAKAAAMRQAGNAVIQGCLDGDTLIQTKERGIVRIKDVVNTHMQVWDGDKWSNGDIVYSGKKQKCVITFTNGQKFICSPIHRFLVFDECDYANPDIKKDGLFVKCQYLKKGNAIKINVNSELHIKDYDNRLREVSCYSSRDSFGICHEYKKKLECVVVESVEITEEYIDMYDVCNTDGGYYVADGIITHNTAADIFKMAMARSMRFIIKNGLFGKVFLTNMVHDELLMEIDVTQVNPLVVTTAIGEQMSLKLDGFPPLYIGAGVSSCWAKAKSKDCEIHPLLLEQFTNEVRDNKIDLHTPTLSPKEWIDYFDERVTTFRMNKIISYLTDGANFGRNVHPEIGNLIRLMFLNYISEEGINPKDEKADAERTLRCIEYISEKYNLGLNRENYLATGVQVAADDIEDADYDEDEDEDDGLNMTDSDFEVLDEDKVSGVKLVDLIREFSYVVAPTLHVCGIDDAILSQKQKLDVYGFLLNERQCSADDEGALELVLHIGGGVLKHTDVYVNNIGIGTELEDLMQLS